MCAVIQIYFTRLKSRLFAVLDWRMHVSAACMLQWSPPDIIPPLKSAHVNPVSQGADESAPSKHHLNWFSRFYTAQPCARTQTMVDASRHDVQAVWSSVRSGVAAM